MKRILICAAAMMVMLPMINAQRFGPEQRERLRDRIEAQRVAYITNQLDLTSEESAAFWPIYNEFKEKEREKRQDIRPKKDAMSLTNEEAEALLEQQFAMESDLIALKREYLGRMGQVISPRKVVRLSQVEMEFNRGVLERLNAREGPKRN